MQTFKHPEFVSTTRWKEFFQLPPPKNYTEFLSFVPLIQELHSCVLDADGKKGTFFFQWKENAGGRFDFNKDVIAFNNSELEHCMWLVVDLVTLLNQNQMDVKSCPLNSMPVKSRVINAKNVLKILECINSTKWLKTAPLDTLQTNCLLKWDLLLKTGRFKVPWYIIPACNQSLGEWCHVELLKCETKLRIKDKNLSEDDLTYRFGAEVVCLKRAVECAEFCPENYKTVLQNELDLSQFKVLFWLAKRYEKGPAHFSLLQSAKTILDVNTTNLINDTLQQQLATAYTEALGYKNSDGYKILAGYNADECKDSAETILKNFLAEGDVQALTLSKKLSELCSLSE